LKSGEPSAKQVVVGAHEHKQHAKAGPPVRCAVITVSDTRTAATDQGGDLARKLLGQAGHLVVRSELLRDQPDQVAALVRSLAEQGEVDAVVLTGGTGVSRRDRTYEAISALLDRRLDGFGELFRMLSFHQVGSAAMLSRAVGGICGSMLVFALPGSPAAVELAIEKLIAPELSHLAREVRR
jgi:molybdenum cofactor biosynthesis protein B